MMLRLSLDRAVDADLVERAVSNALTADIAVGCKHISTKEMGDSVLTELDRLLVSG
jgi:transcriptional regulator NrdR family protein